MDQHCSLMLSCGHWWCHTCCSEHKMTKEKFEKCEKKDPLEQLYCGICYKCVSANGGIWFDGDLEKLVKMTRRLFCMLPPSIRFQDTLEILESNKKIKTIITSTM